MIARRAEFCAVVISCAWSSQEVIFNAKVEPSRDIRFDCPPHGCAISFEDDLDCYPSCSLRDSSVLDTFNAKLRFISHQANIGIQWDNVILQAHFGEASQE